MLQRLKKMAILLTAGLFVVVVSQFPAQPVAKAGHTVVCGLEIDCGPTVYASVAYTPSTNVFRPGETVSMIATFTRPLDDSPLAQISFNGTYTDSGSPHDMTKIDTTHYSFSTTIPNDAANGTEYVEISNANGQGGFNNLNGTPTSGASFYVTSFDGGTGTKEDPYQISTCRQLQAMGDDITVSYTLNQDVDCSDTSNWNDGDGFVPVASYPPFIGDFYGKGYVISGLYINRPDTDSVGLFGYNQSADISNFQLTNVNITGHDSVGGAVGRYKGDTMLFVNVSGSVSGHSDVGGVVGENESSVIYGNSSVAVTGTGNDVGGVLGYNSGNDAYLVSTGSITSSGNNVGGLAGYSQTQITDSYSTSDITAGGTELNIGGAVGLLSDSSLSRVYATGDLEINNGDAPDGDNAGGLVGYASDTSTVSDSFADNQLTEMTHSGGVIGALSQGSTISNIFWAVGKGNPDTCVGATIPEGCSSNDNTNLWVNNSTNAPFTGGTQNWDFNNIWQTRETDYPVLRTVGNVTYHPAPFGQAAQVEVQQGGHLTIKVDFNTPIADSPALKISLSGADNLDPTDMTKVSAREYTYSYTGGSGDGPVNVAVTQGEVNIPLTNNAFSLDNLAPVLSFSRSVAGLINNASPSVVINSTKPGVLVVNNECLAHVEDNSLLMGDNSVLISDLTDGTHTCTFQLIDSYTGTSNVISTGQFVVDTTAPVLTVASQVPNPTNGVTPIFTFTTNEYLLHMQLTSGCGVAHGTDPHTDEIGTVDFRNLVLGQTYSCTISGFDAAGNQSNILTIGPFKYTLQDGGSVPIGFLSSGTVVPVGNTSGGSTSLGSTEQTTETQDTTQSQQNLDTVPFTDIIGHWANDFISQLYRMKFNGVRVVDGRSPTLFVPEGNLNRAEAVKIGLLAFGYNSDANDASDFKDVDQTAWYAHYLGTAEKLGFIAADAKGKFYPAKSITRIDALTMYLKMAKKSGPAAAASFTDIDQNSDYAPCVNYAFANGVVVGRSPTLFVPLGTITRAEISKIIIKIKAL